ncbi:MAG: hypothetical protein AUK03_15850 [Anaerolineae bacterium CG2_30_64_16]|nr:MAG: hypothetical protein AUK03_15850 [Anaerolineae bacterium CG2_30_64_16]
MVSHKLQDQLATGSIILTTSSMLQVNAPKRILKLQLFFKEVQQSVAIFFQGSEPRRCWPRRRGPRL